MINAYFSLLGSSQFLNVKTHQQVKFGYVKLFLLLAYLVLENKVHTRDALANLFWPDSSEEGARANLRRALFNLRQAFAAAGLPKSLLGADRNTVYLSRGSIQLDVSEFEKNGQPDCITTIERQLALYKGAFLEGVFPENEDLANWVENRRTLYAQKSVSLLEKTVTMNASENPDALKQSCQQLIAVDDVNELAHSSLIHMYLKIGNKAAALNAYVAYCKILQMQLGIAPSPQLATLIASVKDEPKENSLSPIPTLAAEKTGSKHQSAPAMAEKINLSELTADLISEAQMIVLTMQQWVSKIELLK